MNHRHKELRIKDVKLFRELAEDHTPAEVMEKMKVSRTSYDKLARLSDEYERNGWMANNDKITKKNNV